MAPSIGALGKGECMIAPLRTAPETMTTTVPLEGVAVGPLTLRYQGSGVKTFVRPFGLDDGGLVPRHPLEGIVTEPLGAS